jgi:chitinase
MKINNKQIFSTYYAAYLTNTNITMDMTPSFVDIVNLAFVGATSDSNVETEFLCLNYSPDQIKKWINTCHRKGTKVYVSLLDTPDVHWNQIDLVKYAKNLNKFMNEWNLDGIDVDVESGMTGNYVETFVNLINNLKKFNNVPITYTCYTGTQGPDGNILNQIKDKIDYIQLMAYFDNFDGMVDLYNDYKTIMGDNIIIGVKSGKPEGTSLDEVVKLCHWNSNKKGIMLWTVNRDTNFYTGHDLLTWTQTIHENLQNTTFSKIQKFFIENICCHCLDLIQKYRLL